MCFDDFLSVQILFLCLSLIRPLRSHLLTNPNPPLAQEIYVIYEQPLNNNHIFKDGKIAQTLKSTGAEEVCLTFPPFPSVHVHQITSAIESGNRVYWVNSINVDVDIAAVINDDVDVDVHIAALINVDVRARVRLT